MKLSFVGPPIPAHVGVPLLARFVGAAHAAGRVELCDGELRALVVVAGSAEDVVTDVQAALVDGLAVRLAEADRLARGGRAVAVGQTGWLFPEDRP